jgi:hypothetical protein
MKKYLIISALAFIAFAVKAQSGNGTLYLSKSLTNEAIKNVEAKTSGGSINTFHRTDITPIYRKKKLRKDWMNIMILR